MYRHEKAAYPKLDRRRCGVTEDSCADNLNNQLICTVGIAYRFDYIFMSLQKRINRKKRTSYCFCEFLYLSMAYGIPFENIDTVKRFC